MNTDIEIKTTTRFEIKRVICLKPVAFIYVDKFAISR